MKIIITIWNVIIYFFLNNNNNTVNDDELMLEMKVVFLSYWIFTFAL